MKIYATRNDERGEYVCALLEPEDWKLYGEYRILQAEDEGENPVTLQDREESLKFSLEHESTVIFCLMHGKNPVGQAVLSFEEPLFENAAEATLLYILTKHREQKLADLFYQAQLKYLAEETDYAYVIAFINADNIASLSAARRNGLNSFHVEADPDGGPDLHVCRKKIDRPYRDPTPKIPDDFRPDDPSQGP